MAHESGVSAGQRPEALARRTEDLLKLRLSIDDAKTETGVRSVFVPPWAAEMLQERIQEKGVSGEDRIFTMKRRTVQAEQNRACELVGIHDYTIHDHRHTAAVALARAGMPLHILQRQLGHKNIEMTMKHATFHPGYNDVAPHFEKMGRMLGLQDEKGREEMPASGDSLGGTSDLEGDSVGVETGRKALG